MMRTTDEGRAGFTQTVSGFAALGALFGIELPPDGEGHQPQDDEPLAVAITEDTVAATLPLAGAVAEDAAPDPDPGGRLARVKALGAALAARREQDREGREAALRALADYDGLLAAIQALERDLVDAQAARAGFEDALARPFGDPDWVYDPTLRDDYAQAIAEATAAETAFGDHIAEKRREAERVAVEPTVARLLAERRSQEETARANENAAEANRQRSHALASAVSLRDAGSFQEARRVLGPLCDRFPNDSETRSTRESIDRAERAVKDAAAAATLAEARRLRRVDPAGATALIAAIDTALLSTDRMHEVAGIAADIARQRGLVNPRFLRSRTPNSLAIVAEERGRWEVAVAAGQDPTLRPGNVIPPQLASAAQPLHTRK